MNNKVVRLCYGNNFYNTIGLIDSILIRMVRDLLEIKDKYDNVYIYRNYDRYLASSLIVSFDNILFVDIRFNINSYDDVIYEGMNSYINIFNNTYGVDVYNYKYVMINFIKMYNDVLCDNIGLYSSFNDSIGDKFEIFYFNYYGGYKYFIRDIDVGNKIRWLAFLYVDNFTDMDKVIDDKLMLFEEKKEFFNKINIINDGNI